MTQEIRRVQLTPQTDLRDLVEQVHVDKTPRLLEREGELLAVVAPAESYVQPVAGTDETPAQRVQAFYAKMVNRPDVRALLSRLAKQ